MNRSSSPSNLPLQALTARLNALENDAAVPDTFGAASDDEEFELPAESDDEDGGITATKKKKKRKVDGGMRKTRGMIADKTRGPKAFKDWLEEAELDRLPAGQPSYFTAVVGPPTTRSARKLCSVCGCISTYTCTRCGSKYCTLRCYAVHTDTRCLKFMA